MIIVLDTNVLVSGLLWPYKSPGEIVRMLSARMLQLCYDTRIISEYRNVLNRPKFKLDKDKIEALIDYIEYNGYLAAPGPLKSSLPDKSDEPFLEVAAYGNAKYLVTGNKKHFPSSKCQGVKILIPSEFLAEYKKQV